MRQTEAKTTEVTGKMEEKVLQLLLSNALDPLHKKTPVHGATLYVDAPRIGFKWNGAAGTQDPSSNALLTPQHPMRIASISKTYVAAAILRLWEENRLDLETPITHSISEEHSALIANASYQIEKITPHHLLTHTSGLFDWGDCKAYDERVRANPQHHWTRTEQLDFAMKYGEPYGKPGEVYRYSDTGYILLGEIIEQITRQSLGAALRELLIYKDLGLSATWLEILEAKPEGTLDRAHQFVGINDTYDMAPYFDLYGGGGLVATMEDVAKFFRALFTGKVYKNPNTLNTMLSSVNVSRGGPAAYGSEQIPGVYRMGINVENIEGLTVYKHAGFFGTSASYVPELDAVISFSLTQHAAVMPDTKTGIPKTKTLLRDIVLLLKKSIGTNTKAGVALET